jgi:hypothetical protein
MSLPIAAILNPNLHPKTGKQHSKTARMKKADKQY